MFSWPQKVGLHAHHQYEHYFPSHQQSIGLKNNVRFNSGKTNSLFLNNHWVIELPFYRFTYQQNLQYIYCRVIIQRSKPNVSNTFIYFRDHIHYFNHQLINKANSKFIIITFNLYICQQSNHCSSFLRCISLYNIFVV